MNSTGTINLTTNELAAGLALCGYESMASQIINSMDLAEDENEFDRFIEDIEAALRAKGYWDGSRETLLVEGLEDLLYLLVHSKRKVRCIREETVLFIHCGDENNDLVQVIENGVHYFSVHSAKAGYRELLSRHFLFDQSVPSLPEGMQTMLLSEEQFDQLHQAEPEALEILIQDEGTEYQLSRFLRDFKKNRQEFDNLSLMEMDYIKDYMEMKEVIFMLPSDSFVWHLDYSKVEVDEVYVVPMGTHEYCDLLNGAISSFFSETSVRGRSDG